MKSKKIYVCKVCGYENPKWLGKCPNCQSWNSFDGKIVTKENSQVDSTKHPNLINLNEISSIAEILKNSNLKTQQKFSFDSETLNQFWNQGIVSGSLTLLAGEPGLGKSTLALQILRQLYQQNNNLNLLYITAEESSVEVAKRSQRLNIPKQILLLQANNYEAIENQISKSNLDLVVIDSIQTLFSADIPGSPGSVSQVTNIANKFLAFSKSHNIAIIIIGHVTKEGQIAGPKTLEHLVDSVLLLESSDISNYRTLNFSKHRYGSVENQLLLKMEETGLELITDPSLALLENLENGTGICYGLAIEKNLPVVIEIQALVSKQNYAQSGGFGRREALGLKVSKLNTILAIAEKYLNLDLKSRDVYLQLSGLPKNLTDSSMDLPILLAVLSSFYEKEVFSIIQESIKKIDRQLIFAGRLTLSGQIRIPTKDELRNKTAKNLKFRYNQGVFFSNLHKLF